MKLNNGGWGYREMIIYTCIILFALVFVAMSISTFYDNLVEDINSDRNNNPVVENNNNQNDNDTNDNVVTDTDYYILKENELKNATLQYVNNYSYDLTEDILVVSVDTLVSFGFMDPIYDQSGLNKCTGYSNVYVTDGEYGIVPYINCSNYVTSGY